MSVRYVLSIATILYVFSCATGFAENPCNIANNLAFAIGEPGKVLGFSDEEVSSAQSKVSTKTAIDLANSISLQVAKSQGIQAREVLYSNSVASACAARVKGRSVIYLNLDWLKASVFKTEIWSLVIAIGHEYGHHLNDDIVDGDDKWKVELEADLFAGRVVKALGGKKNVAHKIYMTFRSRSFNQTYPTKESRIASFNQGFDSGALISNLNLPRLGLSPQQQTFISNLRPGHTLASFKSKHGEPTSETSCNGKIYYIDGYELQLNVDNNIISSFRITTNVYSDGYGQLAPKYPLYGFGVKNFPNSNLSEAAKPYLESEVCVPFQNFGNAGGVYGLACDFGKFGRAGNDARSNDVPEKVVFERIVEGELQNDDLQVEIMGFGGKIYGDSAEVEVGDDYNFGLKEIGAFLNFADREQFNSITVGEINPESECSLEDSGLELSHYHNDGHLLDRLAASDGKTITLESIDFSATPAVIETFDTALENACKIEGRYPGKLVEADATVKLNNRLFPIPVFGYQELSEIKENDIDCNNTIKFRMKSDEEFPMSSGGGGTLTLKVRKKFKVTTLGWGGRVVYDLKEVD